jgi:cytochrome c peroxidase
MAHRAGPNPENSRKHVCGGVMVMHAKHGGRSRRIVAYVLFGSILLAFVVLTLSVQADAPSKMPNMLPFDNPTGLAATYSTAGSIDLTNPFFQSFGTNGRACVTCHQPSDAWSVTPAHIRARFEATGGADPIFRTNDGSNSPDADVSTVEARRSAYSMLMTKGLIRVGIGMPPDAQSEFELVAVDDPYGHASATDLSLFRRPLPSTNLKFLSTVMWDGRETFVDPLSKACILGTSKCFASLHFDLSDQANGATLGHAQAAQPLTSEQRDTIVAFESTLFTAQIFDNEVGDLTARHASGGPAFLSTQNSYFGINDAVSGDYGTGGLFDPTVFTLYDAWDKPIPGGGVVEARLAIARGQRLFNSKPIRIVGVKGLNDDLSVPVLTGTCTTCHDAPQAGNHSIPAPLDIGVADASRRTPDLPLYTLRNKRTSKVIETTDPGRALLTGKWNDIGKFKGPTLRALAARAPYFHNGAASDLRAVVDFYDQRFAIGFTEDEKADLVAFLRTL